MKGQVTEGGEKERRPYLDPLLSKKVGYLKKKGENKGGGGKINRFYKKFGVFEKVKRLSL